MVESLVAESQSGAVSEAFDDTDNGTNGQHSQEGLVLDDLDHFVLGLLCLSLVVDVALLDILGGGLRGLSIALRCGAVVEGVAVEEVLFLTLVLHGGQKGTLTYVGNWAEELNGSKHVGGVEEEREGSYDSGRSKVPGTC